MWEGEESFPNRCLKRACEILSRKGIIAPEYDILDWKKKKNLTAGICPQMFREHVALNIFKTQTIPSPQICPSPASPERSFQLPKPKS